MISKNPPTHRDQCIKSENCLATLCPLDPSTVKLGIWYPDEPICNYRGIPKPEWVKKQRKLAKLADPKTFFSIQMVNLISRIKPGIKGADPNYPESESDWLKEHGHASRKQPVRGGLLGGDRPVARRSAAKEYPSISRVMKADCKAGMGL